MSDKVFTFACKHNKIIWFVVVAVFSAATVVATVKNNSSSIEKHGEDIREVQEKFSKVESLSEDVRMIKEHLMPPGDH